MSRARTIRSQPTVSASAIIKRHEAGILPVSEAESIAHALIAYAARDECVVKSFVVTSESQGVPKEVTDFRKRVVESLSRPDSQVRFTVFLPGVGGDVPEPEKMLVHSRHVFILPVPKSKDAEAAIAAVTSGDKAEIATDYAEISFETPPGMMNIKQDAQYVTVRTDTPFYIDGPVLALTKIAFSTDRTVTLPPLRPTGGFRPTTRTRRPDARVIVVMDVTRSTRDLMEMKDALVNGMQKLKTSDPKS